MIHNARKKMTVTLGLTTTLLLIGLSGQVLAMDPFHANYQFSYNGKNMGSATRTLSQQANNNWSYIFSAKAGVIASASETSKFSFDKGQINAQQFSRQSKILVHNSNMNILFNSSTKTITAQKDEKKSSFPWKSGVLDELNTELQIREDLKNNGLKARYSIADAKGIDSRRFVKQGTESIKTPYGTFDTVKVNIEYDNRPNRSTIFWLAPKLDYLPVKVSHVDNKTAYELLLTGYTGKSN